MNPARLIVGLIGVAAALTASAVEYRAQAMSAWTTNLSRTSFAPTAKDAVSYSADVAVVAARQLAPNWTLIAGLEAGAERVPSFTALDRVSVGGTLTLRRKFGLGPFASVVEGSLGIARLEHRESGRDGWREEGQIRIAQRFTETWRGAIFTRWQSVAATGAPYDTHERRLGAELAWDFADRWSLSAGGAQLRGQVTANAAGTVWASALGGGFGSVINDYYESVPWAVTNTFGPGWVAYRVDCRADFWWGELSWMWTDNTRALLRAETARVVNQVDVRYATEIWTFGLVHRF